MLILTIRTDRPEAELGIYDDYRQIEYMTWQAHRELSSTILIKITELLKGQSKHIAHVDGIVVFSGPGSFTGLRIGVTVANTLADAVEAKIVGSQGEDWIHSGIQNLLDGNSDSMAIPDYGSEAHITLPKK